MCEFCPSVGRCTMPGCEGPDIQIQVGQVYDDPGSGNRYRVDALVLGSVRGDGKVKVMRQPKSGRLPPWDDGVYWFHPSSFKFMRLNPSKAEAAA